MSIQLKLDAPALAALFPEGSEIHLELQQAVINETVRKLVDHELTKTRAYIGEQCSKTVKDALDKEGLTSKVWTGIKLSDDYEKKLQVLTTEAVRTAFYKYMSEAMAPMIADLDKRIKDRMDSEMTIKLNLIAKEALRGALK
jgi:hypothetical protein